ncbi:MAG: hypothetical protein IIB17_01810 [Chloroflexi bacterium]|nr:hypothetical protein [Chloroflexota bacterium]
MRVRLTQAQRDDSLAYQERLISRLPDNPNYTGLNKQGRYYLGDLVDTAFGEACRQHGIEAVKLSNDRGVSDGGIDYEIGAGVGVDVKFVPFNGWRFMHSEAQLQRPKARRPDIFVPVKLAESHQSAEIRGFFTYEQVAAMRVEDGAYGAPFRWAPLIDAWTDEGEAALWVMLGAVRQMAL